MYDLSKPGHLLVFSKAGKNYYLYLYISEPNLPSIPLVVLPGIRKMAEDSGIGLKIEPFSEFKNIVLEYDIEDRISQAPLGIFMDSSEQFKEHLFGACLRNLLNGYASIFPVREIGAVARESSFAYYGENFDRVIEDYILQNKNVIIDAPRRAGKTSFIYQLAKEERLDEYEFFYLDMEGAATPQQFAVIMMIELDGRSFATATEKAREELKLLKETGSTYKIKLETRLKEISSGKKIILALDEVSFMLEEMLKEDGTEEVIDFLSWFKNIRMENHKIRFIFSGSIKLTVLENALGSNGFFHDCEEYALQRINRECAVTLVEGLFYSEEIYPPDYVIENIIELTTPHFPFFLQIVTDEMVKYYRTHQTLPTEQKIKEIIEIEIIGTNCRRYLDQLLVNLRRYNPLERKGAQVLLNFLALHDKASSDTLAALYTKSTGEETGFQKVLMLIAYDFYVAQQDGFYFFDNTIIKNWWKMHFAILE